MSDDVEISSDGPEPAMSKREAKDEIILTALAEGKSHRVAAQLADVGLRTVGRRLEDPAFAAEVARRRSIHVSDVTGVLLAAAPKAAYVLIDCLGSDKPMVRLRAAELLLSMSRRFHEDVNVDTRLSALEVSATEDGAA